MALGLILAGCQLFQNQGVEIGLPTVDIVCTQAVPDSDVTVIKQKIDSEVFKDDKLRRARTVTRGKCFMVYQVIDIIDSFTFEDNKVDLAKELYDQTVDRENYGLIIDELVHKSNKDELRDFIDSQV